MNLPDVHAIVGILTGMTIGFLLQKRRRKRLDEPEHDERTEIIAGKASQNTLIVLMAAMAVILWGEMLELFKLQVLPVVAFMFFLMLASMIGFSHYYKSKEI